MKCKGDGVLAETGFGWVLLAMAGYGALHSLLASNRVKAIVRRWLDRDRMRYYRLVYNLIGVLTLLPVLVPVLALPDRRLYAFPLPLAVLAVIGQILAALGVLASIRQTGAAAFLGLQPPEHPPRLVTSGWYRRMRHPIYFFALLFIWLMPVMTANLLAFNLGATAYLIIGSMLEERKLREEFGPAYDEYRRRTPWLIPLPRRPAPRN